MKPTNHYRLNTLFTWRRSGVVNSETIGNLSYVDYLSSKEPRAVSRDQIVLHHRASR
jgi:hypothetical protein